MEQWRRGLPKILVVVAAVAMMVAMPSPGEANSSPEYYQSKSTSTSTPGETKLSSDYYRSTCPDVESIVRTAVAKKIKQTVVTIPATLRLFFHDCFVQGCDASVMIASPYNDAEKDADDNRSLAGDGFDMVVQAKAEVEKQCPGVVSCADILALAAREVVNQSGGPYWNVQFGRLDGLVSNASDVAGKLPGPDMHVKNLTAIFYKNGLSMHDMITLSGAHTVGFAHCRRFKNRLYRYNSTTPTDPSYNPTYATQLRQACPDDVGPTIAVNMDPVTPVIFDNTYFSNLAVGLGLFTSDQVLYGDGATQQTVKDFAANQTLFFEEFKISMIKLGRVGVKSGKYGEIRRDCTTFNK